MQKRFLSAVLAFLLVFHMAGAVFAGEIPQTALAESDRPILESSAEEVMTEIAALTGEEEANGKESLESESTFVESDGSSVTFADPAEGEGAVADSAKKPHQFQKQPKKQKKQRATLRKQRILEQRRVLPQRGKLLQKQILQKETKPAGILRKKLPHIRKRQKK